MAVHVITDSTASLPAEICSELGIEIISLWIHFGDATYKDTEIDHAFFYDKLRSARALPTSSQPAPVDFYNAFTRSITEGHSVVTVLLSSHLSGTYATAVSARLEVLKKHPDAQIAVFDSGHCSMSLGLIAMAAAQAAKEGDSFDTVVEKTSQCAASVRFYFSPNTLDYLQKGGRIGFAASLVGNMLKIQPVLTVENGKVAIFRKVRGSHAVVDTMLHQMETDHREFGIKQVAVQHIEKPKLAEIVAGEVRRRFGVEPIIVPIGAVIGTHVGPGAIGVAYTVG